MSFQIVLFVLCLGRLSLGEPPVAPYPPSGPPSGPAFPQGPSGQLQDIPEIIDARSGSYKEEANHRIHFNLFKDHETKKSKGNISFKLGQGDGQFRNGGDQNFARNYQGAQGATNINLERNRLSQGYGAPQTNALDRSYATPNFNQVSNGLTRPGQETQSRFGATAQDNIISSKYGMPNLSFSQRESAQQEYQADYRNGLSQQHSASSTPQSQYGPPQGFNYNPLSNSNRLSQTYNPQPFGQLGRSNQPGQPFSSQISPSYGAPLQGQRDQIHSRKLDQYQPRSQYNPQDRNNNQQNQGGSFQLNNGDGSSEDMHERANYEFEYEVRGEQSHGHEESREGDEAWGSYKVQLPDGRTMLVEYTADDRGYRPKITYSDQPAEQPTY